MRFFLIGFSALLFASLAGDVKAEWPKTPLPVEITTSPADTEYLRGIMKDAFRSILYFRNSNTGLCSDFPENPNPGELQKAEHHFLMLTSIAIGGKIGLIPETEAVKEIDKTLCTMEKMARNRGFYMGAYYPASADVDKSYPLYSAADCGWIYCALVTVGEAYPQFKKRTDKILEAVDWSVMYDEHIGIRGGIQFYSDGSAKGVYEIRDVAIDLRTFAFIITALGGTPPQLWDKMEEYYVERYGVKYMKPGEAMGYGEQPMSMGYFLDERGSKHGMSCANLGWGQINYARDMEFPTWGWSSCLDVDGYLGWGTDKRKIWSRINTHAVAAQVIYYPNQVVKAFRAMEKLGIRKPIIISSGKEMDFGFRDSIDVDTLESPCNPLPGLDQNIIFLSLANYLYNGAVWSSFMQNQKVQKALNAINDYKNPKKEYLETYKNRDLNGPPLPVKKTDRPDKILVDSFEGKLNMLGGERKGVDSRVSLKKGAVEIIYNGLNEKTSYFEEELKGIDLTEYNALKLVSKSKKSGKVMVNMHLGGEGGYLPVKINNKWSEIIIPFRSFMMGKEDFQFGNPNDPMRWTAMWHDRSHAQDFGIGPVTLQNLDIKEISFLSLTPEEIHGYALKLRTEPSTMLAEDGTLDSMDDLESWSTSTVDNETQVAGTVEHGVKGDCLGYSFTLPAKGGWINLSKNASFILSDTAEIVFSMKGQGGPAHLQVKIVDPSGATFMRVLKNEVKDSGWNDIRVKVSELVYAWGGVKKEKPEKVSKIEFAITSDGSADSNTGKVWFDELKIMNK